MPRLLLILAIGFVLYILLRRAQSMPPHKRRGEYIKIALGASVVVVILLTLAGKMHWVGAALTGLLVAARQSLPVIVRLFPLLGTLGSKSATGQQQSTVTSAILRMHLDHENGNLSGEVLTGPFSDWRLEEMNREQLAELRSYCQDNDTESLQLLEGYLEQRFGEDYGTDPNDKADASNAPSSGMSHKEALDVLGLDESADHDAIVEAHRKLMQKLHPDRGGSDYLAAKINQAKDFLLES